MTSPLNGRDRKGTGFNLTASDRIHTRPQHPRFTFLFMSERDVLCAASGCLELRENVSAEFCAEHAREIQAFERWLAGRPKWLGSKDRYPT